jgi:integrase
VGQFWTPITPKGGSFLHADQHYRRELKLQPTNRGERTSNATVNRYVSALSGALSYAVSTLGWIKSNPTLQVTQLSENTPTIRFLDKDTELPKLTEACGKSDNKRLLPLFMLAVGLGLRASALLWLHITEINLEARTIRIPEKRSKNGQAFTLSIEGVLYPYVKFLYDNCHPKSGLLFPDPANPFKRMCYRSVWAEALKLAGISNFRFHDCRHTCGSYLAMAGYGLGDIAEILNHKTLEMAKRYTHLAEEYRAKLPLKMNEAFLADVSANVVHLVDVNLPAAQGLTNSPQDATITDK